MKKWPNFDDGMQQNINYLNNKTSLDKWAIIEHRYNNIRNRDDQNAVIPKILHQIWLGGDLPAKQKQQCEQLRQTLPPDWQYKLWTNADVDTLSNFYNKKEFDTTPNYGQKSDILRLEILNQYGGIYCDTDIIGMKPFNELLDLDFFCGVAYDGWPSMMNSVIGSSPGNSVIRHMLKFTKELRWNDGMAIIDSTGPYHTARAVFDVIQENTNIVVLPNSFFYPFSNDGTHGIDSCYKYSKPETICCHLWQGAWM
jgi:mannosyltransferase OCH1-like enzyme